MLAGSTSFLHGMPLVALTPSNHARSFCWTTLASSAPSIAGGSVGSAFLRFLDGEGEGGAG